MKIRSLFFGLLTIAAPLRGLLHAQVATSHALDLEDLLRIEELGDMALSPDGRTVAVVIKRARSAGEASGRFLQGNDRGDIWLASLDGQLRRLTDGRVDGSGYWRPVWSPDGERLAMFSTQGGRNIRLFVWNRRSDALAPVMDDGIDPVTIGYSEQTTSWPSLVLWRDSVTVLCAVLRRGHASPAFEGDSRAIDAATRAWSARKSGLSTGSIVDSDEHADSADWPRLVSVDVRTGIVDSMASGHFTAALVSPDSSALAVVVDDGPWSPVPSRLTSGLTNSLRLGIVGLAPRRPLVWVPRVRLRDRGSLSAVWSLDSRSIVVVGVDSVDSSAPEHLWCIGDRVRDARPCSGVVSGEGDMFWADTNRVAFRRGARDDGPRQRGWYLTSRNGDVDSALVTEQTDFNPICREPAGRVIIVRRGELRQLDLQTGRDVAVPGQPAGIVQSVIRARPRNLSTCDGSTLLVHLSSPVAPNGDWYRVTLTRGAVELWSRLPMPNPRANLELFSGPHDIAIFSMTDSSGTSLWAGRAGGRPLRLLALNTDLHVALGRQRAVPYAGDGQTLYATVTLPPSYSAGHQYPTVFWIYPGELRPDSGSAISGIRSSEIYNVQLLAARGYVVVQPSIPLPSPSSAGDPFIDIPRGVLPAVDKLVADGIADPRRLAVLGHSYGGYGVYCLLEQTHRFRAAIAMAGDADLVSSYGTFFAPGRYDKDAPAEEWGPIWSEIGQGRMGASPWQDLWRYIRNSPIFFADRIDTPLLIVQGDQDPVPITQGEEMFTALYRMGKRVRFVRYWGEGHTMESPANMRDMWNQIFSWLVATMPASSPLSADEHQRAKGAR